MVTMMSTIYDGKDDTHSLILDTIFGSNNANLL